MLRLLLSAVIIPGVALLGAGCGGSGAPVVSGANRDAAAASLPTATYLPSAVGYWWKYHEVTYPRETSETIVSIVRIMLTERFDGVPWYTARRRLVGAPLARIDYWRHNSQGLLWSANPALQKYYAIKLPLQVGNTWAVPGGTRTITTLDGTLTVPYGTLTNCLVVKYVSSVNPDLVEKEWFAPGVGLVREQRFDAGAVVSRYDLSKLDLTP